VRIASLALKRGGRLDEVEEGSSIEDVENYWKLKKNNYIRMSYILNSLKYLKY
jgi:hypothetical protein